MHLRDRISGAVSRVQDRNSRTNGTPRRALAPGSAVVATAELTMTLAQLYSAPDCEWGRRERSIHSQSPWHVDEGDAVVIGQKTQHQEIPLASTFSSHTAPPSPHALPPYRVFPYPQGLQELSVAPALVAESTDTLDGRGGSIVTSPPPGGRFGRNRVRTERKIQAGTTLNGKPCPSPRKRPCEGASSAAAEVLVLLLATVPSTFPAFSGVPGGPDVDILGLSLLQLHNAERQHEVLVPGIDYSGRWGSGSPRHFLPVTGWRPVRPGREERALAGTEFEARLHITTTLRVNATGYQWESGDRAGQWNDGVRLGFGWRPHPWLHLAAAYDRGSGEGRSFHVGFRRPLGKIPRPPPGGWALAWRPAARCRVTSSCGGRCRVPAGSGAWEPWPPWPPDGNRVRR